MMVPALSLYWFYDACCHRSSFLCIFGNLVSRLQKHTNYSFCVTIMTTSLKPFITDIIIDMYIKVLISI